LQLLSKHNYEQLTSLGADKLFDYHDEDVLDQIKKYSGESITLAYDTITEAPTTVGVFSVLSTTKPSYLFTSLTWDRTKVKAENSLVKDGFPLAYLGVDDTKKFGEAGAVITSPPGLHTSFAEAVAHVQTLLDKDPKAFSHMPVQIVSGGLEAVPEALDLVRTGKNSGVKIVVPFN